MEDNVVEKISAD